MELSGEGDRVSGVGEMEELATLLWVSEEELAAAAGLATGGLEFCCDEVEFIEIEGSLDEALAEREVGEGDREIEGLFDEGPGEAVKFEGSSDSGGSLWVPRFGGLV